jgi:hypothetical protein
MSTSRRNALLPLKSKVGVYIVSHGSFDAISGKIRRPITQHLFLRVAIYTGVYTALSGDQYIAGIWRTNLVQYLAWYARNLTRTQSQTYDLQLPTSIGVPLFTSNWELPVSWMVMDFIRPPCYFGLS